MRKVRVENAGMPTLLIVKRAGLGEKDGLGQRCLPLPKVRVSVQPGAGFGAGARGYGSGARGYGAGGWGKSLTGGGWGGILRRPQDARGRNAPAEPDPPPDAPPRAAAGDGAATLSPVAFAREVLGVELWSKQVEVLEALTEHRRVAVKAGNGLGKGFCAAVAMLWFIHTHQDGAIALSTAPTFRQVRHILWRQVRRLYRPAAPALGGKMLDTRWEISDDRYALGLSADGAGQFQGFHSPNMFIVVDEAEGVSDEIYEAIEAVMTSAGPLLLLIGNPTTTTGAFRRAFYEEREIYRNITISALDSPNVQAGQVIVPGLVTPGWVAERRQIWGADSSVYRARVLGNFPEQEQDSLLRLSDVEAAVQAGAEMADRPRLNPPPDGVESAGDGPDGADDVDEVVLAVDVARFGADRSVILRRRGDRVEEIQVFRGIDTMALTGRVVAAIQDHQPAEVRVDEIGVGAGVVDRLRELGHRVRGVNVARKARQDSKFVNVRAEAYWNLRDRFVAGRIALPADNALVSELTTLRYEVDSADRVKMESKDDLRKRGAPSPDLADALMLAFMPPGSRLRLWT